MRKLCSPLAVGGRGQGSKLERETHPLSIDPYSIGEGGCLRFTKK
jgi:hypothetical protein